jgi:pyruvate kinase
MIKTKIIATLGPGCNKAETIRRMVDNGVDVFRLNFSHGSVAEHTDLLAQVNEVRRGHQHTIAVMGDLCGPKIRLGDIEPEVQQLDVDGELVIFTSGQQPRSGFVGTNYKDFARDVKVGDRILIDDGQIILRAVEQGADSIRCRVVVGGALHSRKGISLPDSKVSAPSVTPADWQWVDWAIENSLDFLALSFVRGGEELRQLRQYTSEKGCDTKLAAKIETAPAIEHLDDIIDAADVLLVARGDLGVEMDLAEVPLIQKRITRMCRHRGKPVIVATQMLQSMINSPSPTRAEVSDVANAIMDFADAVMLSGETAVGKYPVEAAKTIRRIAQFTESYLDESDVVYPRIDTSDQLRVTAAMAHSVAQVTEDIDAKLVAVWSETGSAARLLSKARIDVPILALSSNQRVCRQMCLHYGVIPRCRKIPADMQQFTAMVEELILQRGWVAKGDIIVLVAGQPIGAAGTTNAIVVHSVTG